MSQTLAKILASSFCRRLASNFPALMLLVLFKPLAASAWADENVKIEKDIAYLGAGRNEKADLYLPATVAKDARLPAVLLIHGGGWTGGDKAAEREQNIGPTLAQHGYAVLSINYKLGTKDNVASAWPQNIHDCKTGVRWLRVNAAKYQLDPDHLGVMGGSAGGHLSALIGVTAAADGLDPIEPWGDVSTKVHCVVDLYGALQMSTTPLDAASDNKTSVLKYLDKSDPPFMLLHGTADKTVPVEFSRQLAAALTKAGIENQLIEVQGAPHTFHLQPKQRDLRPIVLEFLDKHLKTATK